MSTNSKGRSGKKSRVVSIPGEKIEEAAAAVATEASQSILRGLARLANASTAKWIATKEAQAEAAAMAIKNQAEIERDKSLVLHRRQSELDEVEHRGLLERRLIRLQQELAMEQANLEAIGMLSLQLTDRLVGSEKAREIEDDWMFAFARHAQAISDREVQELWAQILSSAAIDGKQKLSAAGLQTMTLLDKSTAVDLKNFFATVSTFGFCPAHDRAYEPSMEAQAIDLLNLQELGLIREDPLSGIYPFNAFELRIGPLPGKRIGLLHTSYSLTKRGLEIAHAIFQDQLLLSGAVQQQYLESIVTHQMEQYISMSIVLPSQEEEVACPLAIMLTFPRGSAPATRDLSALEGRLSKDVQKLIDWASTRYDIELVSIMSPRLHA